MNSQSSLLFRLLLPGVGALALMAAPAAHAQNVSPAPPTAGSRGVASDSTMAVAVGGQQVVEIGRSVNRVALGDPKIADVSNAGPGQLRVLGLAQGSTDLILFGRDGTRRIRISVARDLDGIRDAAALDPALSGARIESQGGRVVLRGDLPSLEAHQRLVAMARPQGGDVVDFTRIARESVVAIEVKFAAVSARRLRQLGFNFSALSGAVSGSLLAPGVSAATTALTTPLGSAFNLSLGSSTNNASILGALSLLNSTDFAQLLAEPTLLVRSGEQASFLAGGEVPVPVPQSGAGSTTITIDYKPFGVRLDVAPVVMADNRIVLKVAPEVSELDYTNAVQIQGYRVPAFRKRSTATTVELASGQSFMIAGLNFNNLSNLEERVPGLGNLPIIGALFSRTQATRDQQELVIIATPRLVAPMRADQVPALPGSASGIGAALPTTFDQVIQRNTASSAATRFGLMP
jgi:pilus assembly protein CpaC